MNGGLIDFMLYRKGFSGLEGKNSSIIDNLENSDNELFNFLMRILGVELGGVVQTSTTVFGNKIYLDETTNEYYTYKDLASGDSVSGRWLSVDDNWVHFCLLDGVSYLYKQTINGEEKDFTDDISSLLRDISSVKLSVETLLKNRVSDRSDLDNLLLYKNPPGTVIVGYFPDSLVIPGYIDVDGALLHKDIYPNIFAIMGYTFGANGDYFKMMDIRGEFLRFLDSGRGIDAGRVLGSYQAQQLLAHVHTGSTSVNGAHYHTMYLGGNGGNEGAGKPSDSDNYWPNTAYNTTTNGDHNHTFTTNNTGASENRVRNIALKAKIRV